MGCGSSQDISHDRRAASASSSLWRDDDPGMDSTDGPLPAVQPAKPDEPNLAVNRPNVLEYLDVDQQVRDAESKNIKMRLLTKQKEKSDLYQSINDLTMQYNECLKQTAKEKADVDQLKQTSVLEFFKDQSQYDAAMSKEQEEYLEALGTQEVVQKEIDMTKAQMAEIDSEINALSAEVKQLEDLHEKQDNMLKGFFNGNYGSDRENILESELVLLLDRQNQQSVMGFFNGNYGSDRENILESELDLLLDRQQRVMVSKDKWQNGRLLLYHACDQLSVGNVKWTQIPSIPPGNLQRRYYVATETRNHMIAASQNIANTGRLLYTIRFPYCTPDEINTLNRAIGHIYTDMQSGDRHTHASQCYYVTHKRTAALLQWFDQVIDKRIKIDLDKARKEAKMKSRELRNERVRLLKEKYLENTGETINVPDIIDRDDEQVEEATTKEEAHAVTTVDAVSGADQLPKGDEPDSLAPVDDSKARIPTPIPTHELAPPPSEDEIFGNLQELQQRHEREMVEFEKAQETNRTRQEQGLHEKLRERRSRRARQEAQNLK